MIPQTLIKKPFPFWTLLGLLFILATGQSGYAADSDLDLFFSQETMVETVSRHPKPLVDIAENIHIVSAAQIEKMNAHTLYEVLNRIPGLYITFNGADFGGDASLTIHGSSNGDQHRVLILLDGIRLNTVSNGKAPLNGVPVAAVERLEIIKGPASSTWGSSIGGVVNIITKTPITGGQPSGSFSASHGERNSRDLRAELESGSDRRKYYVFLGNQHSDGLRNSRYFDNDQIYGKAVVSLWDSSRLLLSTGFTAPEWKAAEWAPFDNSYHLDNRQVFGTIGFDMEFNANWSFHLGGGLQRLDSTSDTRILGTGLLGTAGAPYYSENWDETKANLSGRLVYSGIDHTLVLGAETSMEELDYTLSVGTAAAARFGMAGDFSPEEAEKKSYGLFLNDTFSFSSLTFTPGIRYDYDSISGNFINPSLGVVWKATKNNRFRFTAAQGANSPYLTTLRQSSPFFHPNENLNPEEIISFQAGIESKSIPFLLAKTTLFYHDIDEVWSFDPQRRQFVNGGNSARKGFELELQTVSWQGFSSGASFSYTVDDPESSETDDFYKATFSVTYDNPDIISCQLFGVYNHLLEDQMADGVDDTMVWDLNISRTWSIYNVPVDFFVTIHNLTDEKQYWSALYPNPERWVEAGLRFSL